MALSRGVSQATMEVGRAAIAGPTLWRRATTMAADSGRRSDSGPSGGCMLELHGGGSWGAGVTQGSPWLWGCIRPTGVRTWIDFISISEDRPWL